MRTYYQTTGSIIPTFINNLSNVSEQETSWRTNFPKFSIFILFILQLTFIVSIFILEIASFAVLPHKSTGVGIWAAFPFLTACILTFLLIRTKGGSRVWATRTLIAQFVLLIFTFILIGITGHYVHTHAYTYSSTYNSFSSSASVSNHSYSTKYKLLRAQLVFGILLMFSGFTYVGIYIYVTIVALWQPYHTLDTAHLFHE